MANPGPFENAGQNFGRTADNMVRNEITDIQAGLNNVQATWSTPAGKLATFAAPVPVVGGSFAYGALKSKTNRVLNAFGL